MVNKKISLIILTGVFIIISCYGVMAINMSIVTPVSNGNYSTTLNITINTLNLNLTTSLTCYYNNTGVANLTASPILQMSNTSYNQSYFSNATINIISWTDGYGFNITCNATNTLGTSEMTSISPFRVDNTYPQIDFGVGTLASNTKTNLYNWAYANLSITEVNESATLFNLYYSNGSAVNSTKYTTRAAGTRYINWTSLNDGLYYYNVTINDSAGNTNSTATRLIYLDHVSPLPTLTSLDASQTTLAITIDADGGISDTNSTCWVEGISTGGTITGTTSSQTLYVTSGISCGITYSFQVSCSDAAGNSGTSALTSFSTSDCSVGGSLSGDSSTTTTWTNTYSVTNEQFENGYSKLISAKERIRVNIGTKTHYVGVKSVSATGAVVEIASDPIEVKLDIGEDAKVDIDDDNYYDIYVNLIGIENNKANLLVQKIYEEYSEEEEGVSTSGEIITSGEEAETSEPSSNKGMIILIIIILLALAVGGGIAYKKRQ
ncbi:MAG: hypothetical protein ABH804_02710 [archaeon]